MRGANVSSGVAFRAQPRNRPIRRATPGDPRSEAARFQQSSTARHACEPRASNTHRGPAQGAAPCGPMGHRGDHRTYQEQCQARACARKAPSHAAAFGARRDGEEVISPGRLIRKWLKAGVLEDGKIETMEAGTPQGAVISPLLANVYLHYVFDLWAERRRRRAATGDMIIVRYADDIVVGFQHRAEAERFLGELARRLAEFALQLHPDKTRLIEFGRFAAANRKGRGLGKPETFDFLGFTHICGRRGRDGSSSGGSRAATACAPGCARSRKTCASIDTRRSTSRAVGSGTSWSATSPTTPCRPTAPRSICSDERSPGCGGAPCAGADSGTRPRGTRSIGSPTAGFPKRASFIPGPGNASPSNTQGGSRMRECRSSGSVRGALSNERPYRDPRFSTTSSTPTTWSGYRRSPTPRKQLSGTASRDDYENDISGGRHRRDIRPAYRCIRLCQRMGRCARQP